VELGAFGHCDECVQGAGAAEGLSLQKHRSDLSFFLIFAVGSCLWLAHSVIIYSRLGALSFVFLVFGFGLILC
jgi:hypothetical protein